MQRAMLTTTIALLSACGSSAPPSPKPTIRVQGEAQKQLAAASETNRAIGLKRAIYDSGSVCKRLIGSRFLGDFKNMATWQGDCDDGRSWAIFIGPDGSAQVRPCSDEKVLNLPECRAVAGEAVGKKKTAGAKPAA